MLCVFVPALVILKCQISVELIINVINSFNCSIYAIASLIHVYANQTPQFPKRVINFSCPTCLTEGHDQAKLETLTHVKNTAKKSEAIEEGCFWFLKKKYL